MKPAIVILAAGLGTRMKSGLVKVLHSLGGKPMVLHVLDAVSDLSPEKVVLVLGHQAEKVKKVLEASPVETVIQAEQLGTGHAVLQAAPALASGTGPVMVLCGDTPLLKSSTLKMLLELHTKSRAAVTVLSMEMENPFGYGRIVRNRSGVQRIVEEKDATTAQKKIREVNSGIYCFDRKFLLSSLNSLGNKNAQGEYYLPDLIAIAIKKKKKVAALICADGTEVMGVNSRCDLSKAEAVMHERTNKKWMLEGVTMLDPSTTYIHPSVTLGRDVLLYPNVSLEGKTSVGEGCVIHSGSRIIDTTLKESVTVKDCCVIEQSTISSGAALGPFAHLRPQSVIGEKAKIGNFVEVKKSTFGEGSKASHLSYIGDATVGKDVNIGAGMITCNYDGFNKFQTIIEDNVFVGSDVQMVAPVRIGRDAVIAAGTTVTKDVPADALAISRVPQAIKEGYATTRKLVKGKKETEHKS